MLIKIRKEKGRILTIPVPKIIVKIGFSCFSEKLIKKYADEDIKQYMKHIDFKKIRKSTYILLKDYKGLNIVDIESEDGSKVNIIV